MTFKHAGIDTMRVTRDIQDKGVAEWLQSVPEHELATLHKEAEAEHGWDERFAKSQDTLGALVREAREEVAQGDVLPFDPSNRPQK